MQISPVNNELRFEVSTFCNYHCMMCPRNQFVRQTGTMGLERFKYLLNNIFKETDQFNSITFSGFGEPLYDPTLDDKIEFAKTKGLKVTVYTNGSMLTPSRFKLLQSAGMDIIRVSFYGDTPESFELIHGVKTYYAFENMISNLDTICQQSRQAKVYMNFMDIEGVNWQKCVKFWISRADVIDVWRPHNWGNTLRFREIQRQRLNTCGRPFNTPLQVQVDGTVNMCCFDFNGELTLGDLNTQSIADIFESIKYKEIFAFHKGYDPGSEILCKNCDQLNLDKSEALVFSSVDNNDKRINMFSTTLKEIK